VKTISLGPFENRTREVGLEKTLAESLEDEVVQRGRLEVVAPGEGDVSLTGTIRSYTTQPVAFSSRDEALEYQAVMTVDLTLTRRSDGAVLWRATGLRQAEEYSAVPGTVVTSSSRFQRSALNARDLGRFTDIQVSEGQRREATERLVERLARSIYDQMMEDF
jgi:hypothetical protein